MSEPKPEQHELQPAGDRLTDDLNTTADFRTELPEFDHEQYSNDCARRSELKWRRKQRDDKER